MSGNPAGRPPGAVTIKGELRQRLTIILRNEHNDLSGEIEVSMPGARKIALNLVSKAVADEDQLAINKIIEHLEGKPAQSINLGGQEDNPVEVTGKLEVILRRPKESPDE